MIVTYENHRIISDILLINVRVCLNLDKICSYYVIMKQSLIFFNVVDAMGYLSCFTKNSP